MLDVEGEQGDRFLEQQRASMEKHEIQIKSAVNRFDN